MAVLLLPMAGALSVQAQIFQAPPNQPPVGAPSSMPRLDVSPPSPRPLYVLGPGDRIRIDVFNVPEFSGEQQILLDGSLTVPLVGSLTVSGKSLEQVADELTFQLSAFLQRPIVNVSLITARPLRIAVVGEVNRPGAYTLTVGGGAVQLGQTGASTPSSLQVPIPSVTQILQGAGGITELADLRRIQVRRTQSGGSPQTFTVNLWNLIQTGDLTEDLLLFDGDSIFVPTAAALDIAEASQLASANLSPVQISVNIVGEVARPGTVQLAPNTPMNQAILAAGGFNQRANDLAVELIRLNPNGTVTRREFAVDLAQNLNETTNPALRNTDILVVNPSVLAQTSDVLNQILGPLRGLFVLQQLFD
ncbi:MAG: SLBB domain-containing protein [Cyanophyceae cyanobacterium]